MDRKPYQQPPETVDEQLSIDPATWSPDDVYRLHSAVIVPRPVAWVSTQSSDGVGNLAPHLYFNGIADDSPMWMFSIEGRTDTFWNLQSVDDLRTVTNEYLHWLLRPLPQRNLHGFDFAD